MDSKMPALDTPFGRRVAERLRDEEVIWLTTSAVDGTPQPNPVWFLWDGASLLVYSQGDAARLAHIRRNPRVALHFDSNGHGGDIVVIAGEARLDPDAPPVTQATAYLAKYKVAIGRIGQQPDSFAARYSAAIRITPAKVRGF